MQGISFPTAPFVFRNTYSANEKVHREGVEGLDPSLWHDRLKKLAPLPSLADIQERDFEKALERVDQCLDARMCFYRALQECTNALLLGLPPKVRELVHKGALYNVQRFQDFEYDTRLRFNATLAQRAYPTLPPAQVRAQLLFDRREILGKRFQVLFTSLHEATLAHLKGKIPQLQRQIVQQFSTDFLRRRYFVHFKPMRKSPRAFIRRFEAPLSNHVTTFFDSETKQHYRWSADTQTKTILFPTMPFWDADVKKLCILGRNHDFVSTMRQYSALQNELQELSEVEAEDPSESASLAQEMADLRRRSEQLVFEASHIFNTSKYELDETDWVFCNQTRDEEARVQQQLQELERQMLDLNAQIAEHHNQAERAGGAPAPAAGSDPSLSALQEQRAAVEAAFKVLAQRASREPDLAGYAIRRVKIDRFFYYEWTCPETLQQYRTRLKRVEQDVTLDVNHIGKGWSLVVTDPATLPPDPTRYPDAWYDAEEGFHFWQTYEGASRCAEQLRRPGGTPQWRDGSNEKLGVTIEVQGSEGVECLQTLLLNRFGLSQRDAALVLPSGPLSGQLKEAFTDLPVFTHGEDANHVFEVTVRCVNPRKFGDLSEDVVRKNRNRDTQHSTRDQWKSEHGSAGDAADQGARAPGAADGGAADTGAADRSSAYDTQFPSLPSYNGVSPGFMQLITVVQGLFVDSLRVEQYDAVQFMAAHAGLKNFCGVDYGLSGHPQWQDPWTEFRESLFFKPAPKDSRIVQIPRQSVVALRFALSYVDFNRGTIRPCLPVRSSWNGTQNFERYFGDNPNIPELAPQFANFKVFQPGGQGKVFKIVRRLSLRPVYQERAKMFLNWALNPRNWYWDQETSTFMVFFYSPSLVWIGERGVFEGLVQELCAVRVDHFFRASKGYDSTSSLFKTYIRLRERSAAQWGEVEKANRLSPDLRMRLYANLEAFQYTGTEPRTQFQHTVYINDQNLQRLQRCVVDPNVQRAIRENQKTILHSAGNFSEIRDYYNLTTSWLKQSLGLDDVLPESIDILMQMSARQLRVRRLFWRLFENKFGIKYHEFLGSTWEQRRVNVYRWCPELMGPWGMEDQARDTRRSELVITEMARPGAEWRSVLQNALGEVDTRDLEKQRQYFEAGTFTYPGPLIQPLEAWYLSISDLKSQFHRGDAANDLADD